MTPEFPQDGDRLEITTHSYHWNNGCYPRATGIEIDGFDIIFEIKESPPVSICTQAFESGVIKKTSEPLPAGTYNFWKKIISWNQVSDWEYEPVETLTLTNVINVGGDNPGIVSGSKEIYRYGVGVVLLDPNMSVSRVRINLSAADADASLSGFYRNAQLGNSVASAGDVNGDGFDDFMVSSSGNSRNNGEIIITIPQDTNDIEPFDPNQFPISNGFVRVVFGNEFNFISSNSPGSREGVPPSSLPSYGRTLDIFGSNLGLVLSGKAAIASIGDFNNDGFDDVLLGMRNDGLFGTQSQEQNISGANSSNDSKAIMAGLIYGRTEAWPTTLNINNADILILTEIDPNSTNVVDHLYAAVISPAVDINHDGLNDIVVGDSTRKTTHIIFGTTDIFDPNIVLSEAADASFVGVQDFDRAGEIVRPAGDVNGDGFDDLLITARGAYSTDKLKPEGKIYLIFGKNSGWQQEVSLAEADVTFVGEHGESSEPSGDRAGSSITSAGDVNGDGFDDILISAPGYDADDMDAGKVYLILGHSGLWPEIYPLDQSNAGFTGEASYGLNNSGLASLGDLNQDGLDDFIIGASRYDNERGAAYIIYGQQNGWIHATLSEQSAITIVGENKGDRFGSSIANVGDFNGDGVSDIVVGAKDYDQGDADVGKVYLFSSLGSVASQSGAIRVDKMKLKAGKTRSANKDSFSVSGYLDAKISDFLDDDIVFVQVGSFQQVLDASHFKASRNKQKFTYKNKPGGISFLSLDFKKQKFLLKGSHLSLSGTQAPARVIISFGPFDGTDWLHDISISDVIDGHKSIPLQFQMNFNDSLRIAKARKSRRSNRFFIKGDIAVEDTAVDLTHESVTVAINDFEQTLPAGAFRRKDDQNKFIYRAPKKTPGLRKVIIDLDRGTFKISVKPFDVATPPIELNIQFATYDETAFSL